MYEETNQSCAYNCYHLPFRSPDSVAASKRLFQDTWVADESICLTTETRLQKKMIASWNQLAASSRNFGLNLPYRNIMDFDEN